MIAMRNCWKSYRSRNGDEATPVLAGIDLTIGEREFACVLGPSGCGKTTLLRLLAGLIAPDAGEVSIGGRVVTGPGPERGMVFQDFALLPWADVLDNIAFGLEVRGVARAERLARARALVNAVGLAGFERHYPPQLSGGMQQRVGLARALAIDPSILLMDEPFGSLDSQTRRGLQEDLLRLHHHHRQTVVFVTHSVDEAVRLGDRIVLLSDRPSRVAEVVDVVLPRPRPDDLNTSSTFVETKAYLWSRLKHQAAASVPRV